MKLFFFGLATLAAASGECEVCETFLGKVEKVLTDENISDKGEIEKKLRAMCKEAKEQDNRFCYYTGLTPDAATTMHKVILFRRVLPFSALFFIEE